MCYEVHIREKLEVHMPESENRPHVMRVGWSVDSSSLSVGEAPLSYGYGGTGRSSCNNKFSHYGEPYSTNDVITCYIDLDAVPKAIFFAKNGKYLDVAFRLGREAEGKVFYPHISVKNMRFVANFGATNPFFPPVQGFYFMQHLPPQVLISPPPAPRNRQDCEVLMMVGLPSCGKTTWLDKYVKDHPDKKYNVLGSNDIIVKMKVMGLGRKRNYHGRWDALIKQATGILNEMLKVAKRKNRNYILDQTNVYSSARRRKMGNFHGYHRIAVVLLNENYVLMQRNDEVKRRDGKVIPESAFMEMKANFALPVQGEVFDEVWYVEENEERSQQLIREFNEEGRNWKEQQKKRPIDDAQPEADFKKSRYGEPASFQQSTDQYGGQGPRGRHPNMRGGFQQDSRSQHFDHGGKPNVPVQESHPRDTHGETYHQGNRNVYHQGNQQCNPPFRGRNQGYKGNSYEEQGRITHDTSGRGGYHQGQQRVDDGYQQGGQDGSRYPRDNARDNQPTGPYQGSWGESRQMRNNLSHQQGHQGGQGYGNAVNNYDQAVNPQGDWGKSGPYVKQEPAGPNYEQDQDERGFSRGNSRNIHHPSGNTRSNQDGNYSTTPPTYSSLHSTQGGYKNPNESYYTGNQPGGYDSPQNYHGPYSDPSHAYQGTSESWNAPQRGFNDQSQGYWGSGQGWRSAPGPRNYDTLQPNVPQSIKQENPNLTQQYHQGHSQNYQRQSYT